MPTQVLGNLGDPARPDAHAWATAATTRPMELAAARRVRGPPSDDANALLLRSNAPLPLEDLAASRLAVVDFKFRRHLPELLALGTVPIISQTDDQKRALDRAGLCENTHYLAAGTQIRLDKLNAIANAGRQWYDARAAPLTTFKRAVALARLATPPSPPPQDAAARPQTPAPCLESE